MKKKTLLSLLTGVAIIASTAGTYAAWDKILADTNSVNVTFSKPVTVDYTDTLTIEKTDNLATSNDNQNPIANAKSVTFAVSNPDGKADTLQIIPNITYKSGSDTTTNLADQFVIDIQETSSINELSDKTVSTAEGANGILTENIKSTGDSSTGDGGVINPTYSITITPTENAKNTIAGKPLNITLTAKLSKSTT